MILISKYCSTIYFRCKSTVLAFTLSVTVMTLLLTDLTSAYLQTTKVAYWYRILLKIREKVSPILSG